ncbi:MAG TPA: pyruvate, phosphate dikinase [Limnochordia bacterium]|jgi:pyruvate,orthophosphate dikinase|nr:pyruvate, phosphate dikinase [Limnochordia bacterium]HOM00883.1 pyruvate, phosphate dikinase [Limnochordia bacterium]HPP73043.1 pyruvate, phosphate dikinase [Limnochordia bacterium]
MSTKWVYFFGNGQTEGQEGNRNLVGGKGANLAEMTALGIPVPPGFTITTEACTAFYANNEQWAEGLEGQVMENLAKLEQAMGAKFGDPENPLLVSVRSGARVSMPGMMDTVLNLGLNDTTVEALAKKSGNPRFAWDSYRRFIHMYGDVVMGVPHELFEAAIAKKREDEGVEQDNELSVEALKALVQEYKAIVKDSAGTLFPDDPVQQLRGAIDAVFRSWNGARAIRYRQINNIPHEWGTAVNVQAMVFGNMGETSGTGVAFTRDPSTGENVFYGEYLMNAQGEDVVAGIRTPLPIAELKKGMPEVYAELERIYKLLENHYKDMQDIEFTIQEGKLYLLQTRTGKRTATAAVRIAVEMVKEGLIDKQTAVMRVEPEQLDQLLHPMIDPKAKYEAIAKGLPASPGAAAGRIVFTAEEAEEWKERGEQVILVRNETSPEDIGGMHVAEGILTARGGMTSHAAVVARGMGKCCVAGCSAALIDEERKTLTFGQTVLKEGDWITLNGSTGEVIVGQVPMVEAQVSGDLGTLLSWADEIRALGIRTNADTPHDAQTAVDFGAEGIGLCRTEHMFFEGDRISAVRQMIFAKDQAGREAALAKLLPYQKGDFKGIFKAMEGKPVTVRLLDPPLHEFVPQDAEIIRKLAADMGLAVEELKARIESLEEINPMLGHRGVRLGVTYPEIYAMQARAIFEAAAELTKEGVKVFPEVMIPLVGTVQELKMMKEICVEVAEEVMKEFGVEFQYLVGTMVEIPRACVVADEIASEAEFFSFGTNDLTQMTFGFSRDDAGTFLPEYVEKGILEKDPFQSLDQVGVGSLVQMGVEKGRSTRQNLKIGVCGEHGGDPASIDFFHRVGLDYVSCSPFRVPIARLAAAQANIRNPR